MSCDRRSTPPDPGWPRSQDRNTPEPPNRPNPPNHGGGAAAAARSGDPPPRKNDWHSSLARLERLTAREYEVFLLLREGSTNLELAEILTVSERTIRAHLSAIMDKLELKSRLQACLASYVHTARREDVT